MDYPVNKAAARHVGDLAQHYRAVGVGAIGIVQKTYFKGEPLYTRAPLFLEAQGIDHPVYYDDFSALRKMAGAARGSVGKVTPCFFMIDRDLRVRFFKRGFKCTAAFGGEVIENAAPGEHIEDYLRQLLGE